MKKARTAHEMDAMLWAQGYVRWIQAPVRSDAVRPNELDYLRGIHNAPVLTALSRWLSAQTKKNVRLRSMWQDKTVYVEPYDHSGNALTPRELADLAIITNFIGPAGIQRTMWVLQAKVSTKPTSNFGGEPSRKEIELFEKSGCFSLLDGSGVPRGQAYDAHDFLGPSHWSFLTFHRNHHRPCPGSQPFPVNMRWPGSISPTFPVTESFCKSLVDVCNGVHGVSVDKPPSGDDWSRLYEALMSANSAKKTKYAVTSGNTDGSVMQLAAASLVRFQSLATSAQTTLALATWMDQFADRDSYHFWRRWPRRLRGVSLINGSWAEESRSREADDALILDAFGDGPPGLDGGAVDDGDGDGPGFRHMLFVDVLSQDLPNTRSAD